MTRIRSHLARAAHTLRLALAAIALAAIATRASAAGCNVTVNAIAFGAYNPFAGPRDATGSVAFHCTAPASWISLDAGQSGDVNDRRMTSGGEALHYNVYSDAARTQVFGSMSVGGGQQTFTLYGRIAGGQAVPPGAYSDTLVVTVWY